MQKIPVKIVQITSPSGEKKIGVMLGVQDYFEKENVDKKLQKFENLYLKTVREANTLFYGKGDNQKKYRNLPSSLYWNLGNLLNKFNEETKYEFSITNYAQSLYRDFGLSKDYVYDLLTIAKLFKKEEILDSIPFSYYRALKRKFSQLEKYGIFQSELKRLNEMGINDKLIGRERYKKELNERIENCR